MEDEVTHHCGFLTRWWHRRLRKLDRSFVIDEIEQGNAGEKDKKILIDIFKAMPGQEHWRCPCGLQETT